MQTEILLFTDSSFASREFCERDEAANKEPKGSPADELEKACWSGMLFEMLPDVFETKTKDQFIWKINHGDQFIRVNIGPAPVTLEYELSIDPHYFMDLPVLDN